MKTTTTTEINLKISQKQTKKQNLIISDGNDRSD